MEELSNLCIFINDKIIKMVGIYKITSPTNKIYIGQTWDINIRTNKYQYLHCKGQRKLYNSLVKHSWEQHKFEIIHELPHDVSQEVLDNYEILYWKQYKNLGFEMLNIKEPGKGGKWSEEMKLKFKHKRNHPEWKKFISNVNKNKVNSKETREKMSKAHLGMKQSQETILKRGIKEPKSPNFIKKLNEARYRSVICLNDNKIFKSIQEAAFFYKIDPPSIGKVCRGINKKINNLKFKYI